MIKRENIRPFFILASCFVILLLLVKVIESFMADGFKLVYVIDLMFNNIVASLFISFCMLLVYVFTSFFSNKLATYIVSFLFSIFIISEVGLIVYYDTTGLIMGRELIERPLWETLATVKSTLNFWMIAGVILFIFVYVFLNIKIVNKLHVFERKSSILAMLFAIIVSVPLFFITKPSQNEYVVNKIWYCFNDCFLEMNSDNADVALSGLDPNIIMKYKSIYPERKIIDDSYPLERVDDTDNVLGTYFNKSDNKPNIVFILVESLGSDLFGVNDYGYTFTPFLDSLSKHSLLWTNCLSTTPRSFGAVPAVTGSVPHGTKGFQFGEMPEHNSLYSILKDNAYMTSAFYAGNFSFDKVYDYLVAEKIDYLSPFYHESMVGENRKYDRTYWGYQDMVMLDRSIDVMKQRDRSKPYFDLLITISQHDNNLKLNDKDRVSCYNERVTDIISVLPEEEKDEMEEIRGYLASTLYGDDAVRNFVKQYSELHDDGNYIFVITGDHSLNIDPDNPLNAYHVPLIIWSPLLAKTESFNSVVSHNDIVPSLNALLRDNYNLKTPETIHWLGDGLDTITDFHCDLKTCFLRYTRTIFDGIYGRYYYSFENGNRKAYYIKENLEVEEVDDEEVIKYIDDNFKTIVYVDNYTYHNNKLTANPLFPRKTYKLIKEYDINSVYCRSEKEKPSVKSPEAVKILSTKIESQYDEIKVVLTADVKYSGNVFQDQFINLGVDYRHDKKQKISSIDNISKSFVERKYSSNQWLRLEFVQLYSSKDFNDNEIEIYLQQTKKDNQWNPKHSVKLKNVNIKILGSGEKVSSPPKDVNSFEYQVEMIIDKILADEKWSENVRQKAADKGISFEEQLKKDAVWFVNEKRNAKYKYPDSKVWKHGVYSKYDAQKYEDVFDGLEVDVIYSPEKNDIYVGRVLADTTKRQTLDEWLSFLKNPSDMHYWIDFKNLSVDNAEAAMLVLNLLSNKYGIKSNVFVESKDLKALKIVKKNGFWTMLWVENIKYWSKKEREDTISLFKKIRSDIKKLEPDAISCEYSMFPFLCDSFPEQNIHFWDTPKKYTPENVEFTKKICSDASVKVVLVDYPTPDIF